MAIHSSYMPNSNEGTGTMLNAFATNIPGALATKYEVSADDVKSVIQGSLVWGWFQETLALARKWSVSLTQDRDALSTGAAGTTDPLPDGPVLPPKPLLPDPPYPANTECVVEHDFFNRFSAIVSAIKKSPHYDPADGKPLGIEGVPRPGPTPSVVPLPTLALVTAGHPEVTCPKGVFQGFKVWLTRPGQPQKDLGMSLSRHFEVAEPLPAPGTAEIWTFVVQYVYQNSPFGQMSQPVSITVRG